jgi:carbon monoxide dehydrogenase subunit G
MTDREHSILVQAPRDTIFDLLMDISNLPRLIPIVQDTAAEPGDRVRIQGYIQGHHYVADGYVRVVDVLRRLEWGFGGEGSCSGWVQVDGDDDAPTAWVTAHVSLAPGLILTLSRDEADTVGGLLAASLGALSRLVDGRTPNDGWGNSACAAR